MTHWLIRDSQRTGGIKADKTLQLCSLPTSHGAKHHHQDHALAIFLPPRHNPRFLVGPITLCTASTEGGQEGGNSIPNSGNLFNNVWIDREDHPESWVRKKPELEIEGGGERGTEREEEIEGEEREREKREREREREKREREGETERQTVRQTGRETETQRDTERDRDRQTQRET